MDLQAICGLGLIAMLTIQPGRSQSARQLITVMPQ